MAAWEEIQPAVESAASRKARDLDQRGGDWQYTAGAGNLADQSLTLDADGRVQREYLQRGGDWYVNASGDLVLDADGRNAREYASPAPALVSAITGTKSEQV